MVHWLIGVLVRQTRLHDLYNGNDMSCINQFRKRKAVFSKLSTRLHDNGLLYDSDNFDRRDTLNDMSGYAETKDPEEEDSDKLDLDTDYSKEMAALSTTASEFSSSNVGGLKPNKKNFKRSRKPKTLPPAHSDRTNRSKPTSSPAMQDDNDIHVVINNTLLEIKEFLANPIQVAAPQDPNAPLWNMLKNIALTPEDRMTVGLHLCEPEFQIHRSFLVSMGQEYLERWAYKHLSGDDPSDM